MTATPAIEISQLSHHYGKRAALSDLSLTIERGEIFVFLGPNGGGKTTLFRVLSTLIRPQQGKATVLGFDLARETMAIRQRQGIVFQAPSLDKKLTVAENINQQAALYGLSGAELKRRREEMLDQLGLADRAGELAEKLSGGLRRRVELAKGMIHRPPLLLLDEPSTGLDPGARSDMWEYLQRVRREQGVTIVLTTHLLEEADKADRIAILNEGQLVALDRPDALRATVGGDSLTIETEQPAELAQAINEQFDLGAAVMENAVRIEQASGHQWVARLVEAFPGRIQSVRLGKPTLEDVFIDRTGHRFWRSRLEDSA
ncbi:ABC transporter ATP-binding protein [Lignipirellula cremea]|uniref:Daunorubicin/doxorubicin resistance ATP-binding protein DrrA n=1 Tax=Lignipirellula cremea TaxID=2528010 RepID=A0A518DYU4_9BACT|nr:ABC transporter ATP-binding protein [Lignipirellula cremea]QDU97016.1 Daunorubicin/doxorubicin resistance ATP-binding protein DrrA [Lignipirellula cremea]